MDKRMLSVQLVIDHPLGLQQVSLVMPVGAVVQDALNESSVVNLCDVLNLSLASSVVGIFGKKKTRDALLHEGDRIEIYQSLQCDPKEMRRLRARVRTKK